MKHIFQIFKRGASRKGLLSFLLMACAMTGFLASSCQACPGEAAAQKASVHAAVQDVVSQLFAASSSQLAEKQKVKDIQAQVVGQLNTIKRGEVVKEPQFNSRFGQKQGDFLRQLNIIEVSRKASGSLDRISAKLSETKRIKKGKGTLILEKGDTPLGLTLDLTNPNPLLLDTIKMVSVYAEEYGITAQILSVNINYIDQEGNSDVTVNTDWGEQTAHLDPYGQQRSGMTAKPVSFAPSMRSLPAGRILPLNSKPVPGECIK